MITDLPRGFFATLPCARWRSRSGNDNPPTARAPRRRTSRRDAAPDPQEQSHIACPLQLALPRRRAPSTSQRHRLLYIPTLVCHLRLAHANECVLIAALACAGPTRP